jgi:sugar/nucleoside kinase (ribokinase family)
LKKAIDVLTFGDMCVDLILSGKDIIPEFNQTEKLIDEYSLELGGSCCIFASQAGKLGLKTVVVGKVGKDEFGKLVVDKLEEAGVSTEYIEQSNSEKTGISIALIKGHDRAILTYNGTIDALTIEDVDEELLGSTKHLHIGSYFLIKKLQPHFPEILKKLKQNGTTISLDTNWDPENKWDSGLWKVLPFVDIIFLNENEAKAITKCDDIDLAVEVIKRHVPTIVIKKGENGSQLFTDKENYSTKAISGKVIDTVGAGDSFDGGFIYGFLKGMTLIESTNLGCFCGSMNVRRAGGIKGQPRLDEVMNYMKQLKMPI